MLIPSNLKLVKSRRNRWRDFLVCYQALEGDSYTDIANNLFLKKKIKLTSMTIGRIVNANHELINKSDSQSRASRRLILARLKKKHENDGLSRNHDITDILRADREESERDDKVQSTNVDAGVRVIIIKQEINNGVPGDLQNSTNGPSGQRHDLIREAGARFEQHST